MMKRMTSIQINTTPDGCHCDDWCEYNSAKFCHLFGCKLTFQNGSLLRVKECHEAEELMKNANKTTKSETLN